MKCSACSRLMRRVCGMETRGSTRVPRVASGGAPDAGAGAERDREQGRDVPVPKFPAISRRPVPGAPPGTTRRRRVLHEKLFARFYWAARQELLRCQPFAALAPPFCDMQKIFPAKDNDSTFVSR